MPDPVDVVLRLVREHAPGITDEAMRQIALRARREIGGDRHYIQSASRLAREKRNERIVAAIEAGSGASVVASRFGLTRQAVWLIAKSRQ